MLYKPGGAELNEEVRTSQITISSTDQHETRRRRTSSMRRQKSQDRDKAMEEVGQLLDFINCT